MTYNANIYHFTFRRMRILLPIVTWILGLFFGNFLGVPSFSSMMHRAVLQPVSIVGSYICMFLPFVLSLYFILSEKTILLLIVCFIKAVAYGFSCTLLSGLYGTASWLLKCLFLFSDSCFLPFIMFIWLKFNQQEKHLSSGLVSICTLSGIFIGAADYYFISPFVERLL